MKVYYESLDGNYKPWSGAVDTWNRICNEGKVDDLENILDELYPDGLSETALNDLLWFESETVFEWLGMDSEDEDDTDEEE